MKYVDVINRMNVLGDALQLTLPAKAMSETLLLRAHYAKGMNEWQTMCEQVGKDMPREEGEEEAAYLKRLNDMVAPKDRKKRHRRWLIAVTAKRLLRLSAPRRSRPERC